MVYTGNQMRATNKKETKNELQQDKLHNKMWILLLTYYIKYNIINNVNTITYIEGIGVPSINCRWLVVFVVRDKLIFS